MEFPLKREEREPAVGVGVSPFILTAGGVGYGPSTAAAS